MQPLALSRWGLPLRQRGHRRDQPPPTPRRSVFFPAERTALCPDMGGGGAEGSGKTPTVRRRLLRVLTSGSSGSPKVTQQTGSRSNSQENRRCVCKRAASAANGGTLPRTVALPPQRCGRTCKRRPPRVSQTPGSRRGPPSAAPAQSVGGGATPSINSSCFLHVDRPPQMGQI